MARDLQLDSRVDRVVFNRNPPPVTDIMASRAIPAYSDDSAALSQQVIDRMQALGWEYEEEMKTYPNGSAQYVATFFRVGQRYGEPNDSRAQAICRAALETLKLMQLGNG